MSGARKPDGRTPDGFLRYLSAKKTVDDRSLNRTVFDALRSALGSGKNLRVLEIGAGIGTMIERLLEWKLLQQAAYTAVDAAGELLPAARDYLQKAAAAHHWQWKADSDRRWSLSSKTFHIQVHWHTVDVARPAADEIFSPDFDLLIAHAFLDLMDLDAILLRMKRWIKPSGLLYLTLNFDGETLLLPQIDAQFDSRIIRLYHRSMDERRIDGRPSGDSRTGRHLLQRLVDGGSTVLAAGSSDWLVVPQQRGYADDEAYFLHYLVDTIDDQLREAARADRQRLRKWTELRHRQIRRGALIFIAKQLDVLARPWPRNRA